MTLRGKFIRFDVNAPADDRSRANGFAALRSRLRLAKGIRRNRLVGIVLAAGLVFGVCTSLGTSVTAAAKLPPANEIGITSTQIHIAMIADVNTPVSPGLFQPSINVMKAWAADVNAHGGLAGRKVVLDVCDSQLNPNPTTNCLIQACTNDFALVGTAALFITTFQNIDACKNEQGQAIGIPDLAGITLGFQEGCDKDTYTVLGNDPTLCATLNNTPQTYTVQTGDYRYFLSKFKHLSGIWVYDSDVASAAQTQIPVYTEGSNLGIKKVGPGFIPEPGAAPESALTPVALAIKQFGATYVGDGATPANFTLLRREAQIQGATSVKVWECNAGCYTPVFIQNGGAVVNGTYNQEQTIPFYSECKLNPALSRLASQMGGTCGKIDSNSIGSFVEALLFQDAVQKIAASGKTLNRASLFAELKDEHSFNAGGVIGPTDVGNHKLSPCFDMVQVIHGKWQRVYPTKPGSLDCSSKNLVTFQYNGKA